MRSVGFSGLGQPIDVCIQYYTLPASVYLTVLTVFYRRSHSFDVIIFLQSYLFIFPSKPSRRSPSPDNNNNNVFRTRRRRMLLRCDEFGDGGTAESSSPESTLRGKRPFFDNNLRVFNNKKKLLLYTYIRAYNKY